MTIRKIIDDKINKIKENEKFKRIKENFEKEESKIVYILEKLFLVALIIMYNIIFVKDILNKYISSNSNIYTYLGVGMIFVFLAFSSKGKKKFSFAVVIWILAFFLIAYSFDGNISEKTLQRRDAIRKEVKTEEKYYKFKSIYGELNENAPEELENNNDFSDLAKEYEFEKPIAKSSIGYDRDANTWYVKDRLVVIFKEKKSYLAGKEFAQSYNMKLVGYVSEFNQFTFELPNLLDFKSLTKQKEIIQGLDVIQIVDYLYAPEEAVLDLKAEGFDQITEEEKKEGIKKYIDENGVINVDTSNYLKVLELMYQYPDAFVGKEIKLKGKTFKDDAMTDKQMGLGMWQMWCCSLDLTLIRIFNNI